MSRELTRELLKLDVSREDVDKNMFIEYVKNNPNSCSFENQNVRQMKTQAKSKSKSISYQ